MIATIKYKGIQLDVEGFYKKEIKGYYYTTPENASFEIESIIYKGTYITALAEAFGVDLAEIERIVLEQVRD